MLLCSLKMVTDCLPSMPPPQKVPKTQKHKQAALRRKYKASTLVQVEIVQRIPKWKLQKHVEYLSKSVPWQFLCISLYQMVLLLVT